MSTLRGWDRGTGLVPLRRCERRSGGAGRVFGDDLVDAAGKWKLVPNRLLHQRAETIVVGCARPNDCRWPICMDRPRVASRK